MMIVMPISPTPGGVIPTIDVANAINAMSQSNTAFTTGVGFSVISLLIMALGYFMKKQLDAILFAQKDSLSRQRDCRETLSERFADKPETIVSFQYLNTKTDRHENAIVRHEAILCAKGLLTPNNPSTEGPPPL